MTWPIRQDLVQNPTQLTSLLRSRFGQVESDVADLIALAGLGGGTVWHADSGVSSSGNGKTWGTAFKTITEAVAAASAGDTILIKGTAFDEAVTLTSKAGLRLIGAGTGPNQTTWTDTTVDTVCLTINSSDVIAANIKFRPPAYSAGTPAGVALGASGTYANITGCRFQGKTGSYYGIKAAVGADNATIDDCEFIYLNNVTTVNGTAIYGAGTAASQFSGWKIRNCDFNSCKYDIALSARCCELVGNRHRIVGLAAAGTLSTTLTTQAINLINGATGTGGNLITKCTLGGAYTLAHYQPSSAGDDWTGNYAAIVATVAPNGLTVLPPAA